MIAVCMPSRGLVHSRTMNDLLDTLAGEYFIVLMEHGRPIPDSHNAVTERAKNVLCDYILLVEDDMQLPLGIVKDLKAADADIAIADYPVHKNLPTVKRDEYGNFLSAGLGCVLIKPHVFDKLERPWFRTDTQYIGTEMSPQPVRHKPEEVHGLQDTDFWVRVRQIPDITIKVIETKAGQYNLIEPQLPRHGNHTGEQYKVETWKF